ncbi:hypothetical protein [Burkholderia sp. ABCPW 14]|uniref:hypothetical protein n=1 Tax=Burkholderia sp. ABCPW 14 TaxID=1637860 RepID=UPI0012E3E159|nr:hypothetical protein [Burkholderia sp. ABCPW 14]
MRATCSADRLFSAQLFKTAERRGIARIAGKTDDACLRAAQRRTIVVSPTVITEHLPKPHSNRDCRRPLAYHARTHPFLACPNYRAQHLRSSAFDATLKYWKSNLTEHQFQKTSTIRIQPDKTNESASIESIKYSNQIILNLIFLKCSQKDRTPLYHDIEIKIRNKSTKRMLPLMAGPFPNCTNCAN